MDYRRARSTASAVSWVVAASAFALIVFIASAKSGLAGTLASAAAAFLIAFVARRNVFALVDARLYRAILGGGVSRLVSDFVERIRTCFTMPEFVTAIRESLERSLDASVVLIRSNTWEVVYASPAAMTADPGLVPALKRNFRELSEGLVFVDEKLNLTVSNAGARGFSVLCKGYYFFVFSRVCPYVDQDAYRVMYGELLIFFDRVLTVAKLFDIAALTKEWRQIAETQRTFLPEMLPDQPKLGLAAYWRPLVNVSGDFYDAIRVDDDRTLLVMGDVSGKGLAAALVMGIVINTIRAAGDKTDLAALVRACDGAIRGMGFDDKYIVMFLGLVDVGAKRLRYVNAALPEQFVVVRTVKGPVVKRLASNCGIVGLVPIESVEVEEMDLRTDDVIVLTTDGLTEISSAEGVALDDSPEFAKLMGGAADMSVDELVDRLATLGETYVSDRKLHDDITILAAKVGRLWA
ncbi:MAG: SpoIIE family protein phosphatase [Spirochaetes bacterium]|nr:SpoIIE family protein phosphatase [Spirochaetota bacterium]MBU1081485.1 SpoIIE family protein phosphatase [Spirochaetota bacterium]